MILAARYCSVVVQAKEESAGAPRMLKISLTDGSTTCHAVEVAKCDKLSLNTPPGSKIRQVLPVQQYNERPLDSDGEAYIDI